MNSPEPYSRSTRTGGWDSRRVPPRGARGRVSPSLNPSTSTSYLHYHGIKERVEAWLADLLLVEPDDPLLHLHGLIGAEINARKQLNGVGAASSRSSSRLSDSSLSEPAPREHSHVPTMQESAESGGSEQGSACVEEAESGLGSLAAGEVGFKALVSVQGLGPEGGPILFSRRAASEAASLHVLSQWCDELASVVRNRLLPSALSDREATVPAAAVSPVDNAVSKLKSLWDGSSRLQEVFEWLDQDKSGYIDHVELRSAMQLLGAPISEEEAMSVLEFLDADGDMKINYAEFQQAIALVPSAANELQHWLASLDLPALVARCLPTEGPADALKTIRSLSFQDLYATTLKFTNALAHHLWSSLQGLNSSSSSSSRASSSVTSPASRRAKLSSLSTTSSVEAAAKFAVASRHMVTNHPLYRLHQGVENIVGYPHNQVLEAIQAEHCSAHDSADDFVDLEGRQTNPRMEWAFLVTPSECPPELVSGRSAAGVRELMKHPMAAQAGLRAEELMALRLCTGPMLFKYNASLRGKGSVPFTALKGNGYATTIHAIVSGISKLSQFSSLDKDQKVFVGLEGLLLPECLWKEDANGHRGGVVKGLLCTTSARDMAIQRPPDSRGKPTVFEISPGQIDRGASVAWLSQRPRSHSDSNTHSSSNTMRHLLTPQRPTLEWRPLPPPELSTADQHCDGAVRRKFYFRPVRTWRCWPRAAPSSLPRVNTNTLTWD